MLACKAHLTATEQTGQDIVWHAMTGYAEFSRDNAVGFALVLLIAFACSAACKPQYANWKL